MTEYIAAELFLNVLGAATLLSYGFGEDLSAKRTSKPQRDQ